MSVTLASNSDAEIARKEKTVLLAAPRGFCAGVDRAIQIVEKSIMKFGAPVYVRHEIVHNRHVVERLSKLGAIFVEELSECPDDRPVVFSAHGVPKAVPKAAIAREMTPFCKIDFQISPCLIKRIFATRQRIASLPSKRLRNAVISC